MYARQCTGYRCGLCYKRSWMMRAGNGVDYRREDRNKVGDLKRTHLCH
jgi:hypothetical protein